MEYPYAEMKTRLHVFKQVKLYASWTETHKTYKILY